MITAITNAGIFEGEQVIGATTVLMEGGKIISIGGEIPEHAVIMDAKDQLNLKVLNGFQIWKHSYIIHAWTN